MSAGINQIHRIVIAIAIQVQAVDGFRIQVSGIIGADEAAPFGAVIAGVAIIQAGIVVEAVAVATNMVSFATSSSASLFYHFSRLQSRKSLPCQMTWKA